MPKYAVEVVRLAPQSLVIVVEADSPAKATAEALRQAPDHDFSGVVNDAEYKATDWNEVE